MGQNETMRIEARVVDIDTGNTYFTRTFADVGAAQAFADEHRDEQTDVRCKLIYV